MMKLIDEQWRWRYHKMEGAKPMGRAEFRMRTFDSRPFVQARRPRRPPAICRKFTNTRAA